MMAGRLRGLVKACRTIVGIPDYDSYLEHMRARHPGAPVLSAREFHAQAIDRKYAKKGARCC